LTQQRLWLAFAIVLGVSFAIQVSWPPDLSDRPETTYDTAPRGHAGVFALLERFDETRGRWLSGLTMPSVDETIWWITPGGTCEQTAKHDAADAEPENEDSTKRLSPFEISVGPWIEAGGTAVVWLSHPPLAPPLDSPLDASDSLIEDAQRPDGADASDQGEASSAEDQAETDARALREEWEDSLEKARQEVREGVPGHCLAIAGFRLPARRLAGLEGGVPPIDGRVTPIVFSIGRATERREDFDYDATRILPGPTLAFFSPDVPSADTRADGATVSQIDTSAGWRPLWVEADDFTPLALERSVGEGRLVVIADARVLSNGRLARVDSAPFVFDWVRDYGSPWIDEHAHGVVPEAGTFRYLARSPAWAAGLGLLVLGGLVIWRGNAWPTRVVEEFDPDAPTLAAYVDSVARLYSGTRDHARVFERYRAVCQGRIRRALGLAPGTGVEIILASLRLRAQNWPELRDAGLGHLLTKSLPIPGADDLARNAARLDDLVRVLREGGRGGQAGKRERSSEEAGVATTKGKQ